MEFFQALTLAVVQGITEFLPISSSAHLILVPVLTGWPDQGLGIDVAMHIGSLAAVMLYFRRDVAGLAGGLVDVVRGRQSEEERLLLQVLLATVPVVVAGFVLHDYVANDWRNPVLISVTTALFGIVLWLADRRAGQAVGCIDSLSWRDAAPIGLAQAVALVPGVSRSGITMTAPSFSGRRGRRRRASLCCSRFRPPPRQEFWEFST